MKKLFIISAIAFSGLIYNTASAQIRVRLGLNLAPQRVIVQQEPVYNSDGDDYYYLPDVDAYYDVNDQCYVYFDGDNWISAAYLPGEYRDYDWRNARRYEVRAARPYMHADFYRSKYDGHQFSAWSHNNAGNRSDNHRFDRGRGDNGQHNGWNGQRGSGQQNSNHGSQGGYTQPAQPAGGYGQHGNNGGQGGYSQPAQPNGGNGQHNHGGQSDHGQSAQPNGGNDHNRGNGGADQHVAQGNPRGGLTAHRMARF